MDKTSPNFAGICCHEVERQMLELWDTEKRRIGHDLHDGVGQQMTGIGVRLSSTVCVKAEILKRTKFIKLPSWRMKLLIVSAKWLQVWLFQKSRIRMPQQRLISFVSVLSNAITSVAFF